jgi:hypothetical protein
MSGHLSGLAGAGNGNCRLQSWRGIDQKAGAIDVLGETKEAIGASDDRIGTRIELPRRANDTMCAKNGGIGRMIGVPGEANEIWPEPNEILRAPNETIEGPKLNAGRPKRGLQPAKWPLGTGKCRLRRAESPFPTENLMSRGTKELAVPVRRPPGVPQ